jgi:hypothetical protein
VISGFRRDADKMVIPYHSTVRNTPEERRSQPEIRFIFFPSV